MLVTYKSQSLGANVDIKKTVQIIQTYLQKYWIRTFSTIIMLPDVIENFQKHIAEIIFMNYWN